MKSLLIVAILVHNAPSGWKYPQECCLETDCHPVSCELLRETENGISYLQWEFKGEQIRRSEDGFCHVCIGHYGPSPAQTNPHCLFMTPRT